jgi:16S rRNA (cytosine1402-N4)-methyltransferase
VCDFDHKPVMLAEILAVLQPKPEGRYADGTVGGGGHAAAILAASSPSGWLCGCDHDGVAVEAARRRLSAYGDRFDIWQGNFADLPAWVPADSCDGVLFDLGLSSPQLDVAERGFSFQQDGPLDMRMDRRQRTTAAELVNRASEGALAKWFWELGDEPQGRRFARAIVRRREEQAFETTRDLAGLIEQLAPRQGRKTHPATRVFQALRMAVNDELGSLARGLEGALRILKSGGRLAVITFHSIEDRVVKDFGRDRARTYRFPGTVDVPELREPCEATLKLVQRRALKPSEAEVRANPRSRSAQLRAMEKI